MSQERQMTTAHRIPITDPATWRWTVRALRARAEWWRSLTEYARLRHWLGFDIEEPHEETEQWSR